MSWHAKKVLEAQAGYPKGKFDGSFDPAMGRGYRAGDAVRLEAGETRMVNNHGLVDGFFRWKVRLHVEAAADGVYAANRAFPVEVTVHGKNENDRIPQVVQVPLGGGQVIYVPGRSLEITVTNLTAQPLILHYGLDEATPGLSAWETSEILTGVAVETALDVPAFANSLRVFCISGGPAWILRGYDNSGTLIYQETLAVPRSADVELVPSLLYTIEPLAASNCAIHYQCVG